MFLRQDYTSGSLDGGTVSGSLSMGSSYASASTANDGPIKYLSVSISYTYGFGEIRSTFDVSNSAGNLGGTVSTDALANHYNPQSLSAYASHSVSGGGYLWSGDTSIG